MKRVRRFVLAPLLVLGVFSGHSAAPAVLNVDGTGRLLGASGVDVGGSL